jgi:hypothetical protein
VGRILLDRVLGVGGMGEVYLGFDEGLRRRVAVKTIRAERRLGLEARGRFLREARILSQLDHPAICRVYDLIAGEDADYLVLELVDGETLRAALRGGMARDEILRVVATVAEALAAAHRQGIVHRDLKPENIMLTPDGGVKVLDFGIARSAEPLPLAATVPMPGAMADSDPGAGLGETAEWDTPEKDAAALALTSYTREGAVLGTARYMSPEQASGGLVSVASDLYSLGVMLHELLAGRPAYGEAYGADLLLRVARADTEPLTGVPRELRALVGELERLDPLQRPTAEAVAARLRRHLDAPRRRRRRLVIGAALGAGTVALLVAAAMAVQARVQAKRQVMLAQRFALRVEEAESLLWREYSLEPHDIRPAKARVERRLEEIEAEMRAAGAAAVGPGNAALGRGRLALGHAERAREHLEAAWNAGFRDAETAYALGLAYGELYEQELGDIERSEDAAARESRRAVAEKALRDPALTHLRAATRSEKGAPEYVEALIASYERRWDDALERARAAFDRVPWLYQAKVLEGTVLTHVMWEHGWADRPDAAMAAVDQADAAFRRAARIGESDPRPYLGRCLLWSRRVQYLNSYRAEVDEEHLREGLAACEAVVAVDADQPLPFDEMAEMHGIVAEEQVREGADPTAAIDKKIAAAQRAADLDPGDFRAALLLADALYQRGQGAMNREDDPRPSFEEALGRAAAARRLHPNDVVTHLVIAGINLDYALYQGWIGDDPREWITASEAACVRVLEISPGRPSGQVNLGIARWLGMRHRIRVLGEDPDATLLEETGALLRRVTETNATFFWAHRTLGIVQMEAAVWARLQGADAGVRADEAVRDLERAMELCPEDQNTSLFLGDALAIAAQIALDRGASPMPLVSRARAAARRAGRLAGGTLLASRYLAEAELVEAEWEVSQSRSPLTALARAEGAAQRVLSGAYERMEASELLARIHALRAQWLAGHGAPAAKEIERGIAAADAALEREPRFRAAHLVKGRLLLLRARVASEPGRRGALAGDALGSLLRGVEGCPGVAARLATTIAQARATVTAARDLPSPLPPR